MEPEKTVHRFNVLVEAGRPEQAEELLKLEDEVTIDGDHRDSGAWTRSVGMRCIVFRCGSDYDAIAMLPLEYEPPTLYDYLTRSRRIKYYTPKGHRLSFASHGDKIVVGWNRRFSHPANQQQRD